MYEAVPGADRTKPKGKGTIYIDGVKSGEGTIDNIVLNIYSISDPFDVGVNNGGSVDRKSYSRPLSSATR